VTQAQAVAVTISPSSASLQPGATKQFTATVSGSSDMRVTWSAAHGTVDANGFYTAPQSGSDVVTATSAADPAKSASATVQIASAGAVSVSVSPDFLIIVPNNSTTFHATVTGTSDTAVTWSIAEGAPGGAISAAGVYQSPSQPGEFHVVATSHADPSSSGSALVSVRWSDMVDYGSGVLASTRTFAVWWGDQSVFGADVRPHLEGFLSGLDGSTYLAVADQYMRGAKTTTTLAGSLVDTGASTGDPGAAACRALTNAGITNPYGGGWIDPNGGYEVADKCTGSLGCYSMSTGTYQVQMLYSNATHACGP
jgi:hypothetical protein